jgi:primosomal protein N' (replication factor Y)
MKHPIVVTRPFDRPFTYRSPAEQELQPGQLVKVEFGASKLFGVVYTNDNQYDLNEVPEEKIKEVLQSYPEYNISTKMLEFCQWVASYNIAPLGMVLKMCLPKTQAFEVDDDLEAIRQAHSDIDFTKIELNSEQEAARQTLIKNVQARQVTLIDGVTGSGKTEVYLSIAEDILKAGGQALIMLPEIVLTTQLVDRFTKRCGFKPVVWHSGLTPKQRRVAWKAINTGAAKLVVGPRSALMLPYQDLRLVVVDEEHDQSYKQEEGVLYNARDMAIVRAKIEGFAVILASATPSVETVYNVQQGRYQVIKLHSRYGEAILPEVRVIDLNRERMAPQTWLSPTLREAMAAQVQAGKQCMLFLNKRGYAPLTMCGECKHKIECPDCNSWLVEHRKKGKLMCHYCGFSQGNVSKCPECGSSEKIASLGPGVERLEEEVHEFMPDARVVTFTSDIVDNHKLAAELIEKISNNEVDIIIGTQMLAKGLHFGNLRLVAVVETDANLVGGDIRTMERTYQLLNQVAGRAGRECTDGLVYLQTFEPDGVLIKHLLAGDKDAFIAAELQDRELANMPPYARLAIITASSLSEGALLAYMRRLAEQMPEDQKVLILGPSASPIFMIRKRCRYRFIVRTPRNVNIQKLIQQWLERVECPANVNLKVDVDPYSFV